MYRAEHSLLDPADLEPEPELPPPRRRRLSWPGRRVTDA
jgi:hypothetical protein